MNFTEFLKLCTTVRSLYDKQTAQQIFEKNVGQFYKLGDFWPKDALQFSETDIQ